MIPEFEFAIDEDVEIFAHGNYESTVITGRTRIGGQEFYTVEIFGNWQPAAFIRKQIYHI